MEKSTAEQHLKFLNETIIPIAKHDTNEAAENMQSYCRDNPDLIDLYASRTNNAPYMCGLFEGGDKIKRDIVDYVGFLKDVIDNVLNKHK